MRGGGGRGGQNDADNEYAQRLKAISKGREEAKGAYDSPLVRNASQNYPLNVLPSQLDFKNNLNSGPTGPGMPGGDEKDKYGNPGQPPGAAGGPQTSPTGSAGGFNPRAPVTRAVDPRVGRGPEWQKAAANGNIRSLLAGLFDRNRQPRDAADPLVKGPGVGRKFEDEVAHTERSDSQQKASEGGRNGQAPVPPPGWGKPAGVVPTVPPVGDLPPSVVPAATPLLPAPVPLHLGSMRAAVGDRPGRNRHAHPRPRGEVREPNCFPGRRSSTGRNCRRSSGARCRICSPTPGWSR